jgi:hypothetical protein
MIARSKKTKTDKNFLDQMQHRISKNDTKKTKFSTTVGTRATKHYTRQNKQNRSKKASSPGSPLGRYIRNDKKESENVED